MKARVASRLPSRAFIAVAFLLCSFEVLAQPAAPPAPTNFFTDAAGVVPADAAARIEERLREFEKASSNQLLVVVADRIPAGYASLEEYTNRTAEAWRVGDKSRDNGAVLFVFVGDRKMRIEVGYGLEGALPDALASRIINDEITPPFRAGKYDQGVLAGVDAIIRATRGEYQPRPAPSYQPPDPTVAFAIRVVVILGSGLFFLVFIVGPFVLLPYLALRVSSGSRTYTGGGSSRSNGGWRSSDRGRSSGGSSWSGGSSRSSGGGGGGGFSGGGGSFGGGGASGSW